MRIETYIDSLVSYAMNRGLAEPEDHQVLVNRLLDLMGKDDYIPSDEPQTEELEEILAGMLDYAVEHGLCDDNITARDLYDTRIMGALTPMPREVIRTFREKYEKDPAAATDWYYRFSCDTDYIRRYRIARDMRWKYAGEYGEMDITINLSKPEKDPKAIAAAKNAPQSGYPKCQLCRENEGYAGRMNHPARENHRIIPITVAGQDWCLQYSPYV
ncbi:MAG: galactose-1-phosphate uridylyltransferase, partial [Oscillospiraceae bacterium]|nr:galactose-1-phosphate uridylyltransferase [Oscillospiraceae bacterium]